MRTATALRVDARQAACALGDTVGALAATSLVREIELTPKPGLVDRANSGAHRDMYFGSFRASIAAIAPWFPVFFRRGVELAEVTAPMLLPGLRRDGIACERAMFTATGGVNTHKGSVFSLGLLCAAAGRLHGRGAAVSAEAACTEVAAVTAGLVVRELRERQAERTAGERLYLQHGLTGARGEAESGFATARNHGVIPYVDARAAGIGEEAALHEALLHLMAHNDDTNVVSRGGLAGLQFVQAGARRLLATPIGSHTRIAQLAAFDAVMIERNLSPGGSADLLAVSWFLAHLDAAASPTELRFDEASLRGQDRSSPGRSRLPLRLRAGPRAL